MHADSLLKNYDTLLAEKAVEERKEKLFKLSFEYSMDFDRINPKINEDNRTARIGYSGKYYCGGPLGVQCLCCGNECGPTNGCNCAACMKLDIQNRMLKKGYLVNKEGRSVRLGSVRGNFYCGGKLMVKIPGNDGWCGPTNGD